MTRLATLLLIAASIVTTAEAQTEQTLKKEPEKICGFHGRDT
jgi:hypothetical protein